ncbi:PBP GOBP domain containing protein [Asbolus verrucosus]|uniref:PBP GOBP domain containing protein n=1 Tax=Asbolus verrucosus TaxID=1661398 RepID=A0A482W6F4_ASBVE|nr:PBP GOBP domain containing protein [Asbolus verrucosus]
MSKSGLSDETIGKARQGDFAGTSAMKKHLLCFAGKHELINKNGDINHKNLKERVKKILGMTKPPIMLSKNAPRRRIPLKRPLFTSSSVSSKPRKQN